MLREIDGFFLLFWRSVKKIVGKPFGIIGAVLMSLFFLFVYSAGIGAIDFLPQFKGSGYIAFFLPVCLVQMAMGSAAGAGGTLFEDVTSGYFRRIALSPITRVSLILAPVAADGFAIVITSSIFAGIAVLAGVPLRYGWMSFTGIIALNLIWGLSLSAISAGILARTGKNGTAALVTTIAFTLCFLTTAFLPKELITAKWLLVISAVNPVTYFIEAMRALLAGTSEIVYVQYASFTGAGLLLAALIFAASSRRRLFI